MTKEGAEAVYLFLLSWLYSDRKMSKHKREKGGFGLDVRGRACLPHRGKRQ